jgi:hypothetical protein
MVPDPGPFSGTFDASLSPTVRVCELAGSVCGNTIKTFTTATAEPVEVSANRQTYGVNWSTKNNPSSLTTSAKYRIEVRVGTDLLGFADLAFVKTSKDVSTVPAGTVAGVLGSPVNIKFRIETRTVGSVTVTPATASITLPGQQTFSAEVRSLSGTVIPNAVVAWTSGNLAAATLSPATGASANATGVAAGTAIVSATAGGVTGTANLTVMRKPNAEADTYTGTVAQRLSPGFTSSIPTLTANDDAGSPAGTIASIQIGSTTYPLPLPNGGVPVDGGTLEVWADGNFSIFTTQAGQHSFSYTLTNAGGSDVASVSITMGNALPAIMTAISDLDQTGTVGTAAAEPPSVRVTDEYGNPVTGVSVAFTVEPVGSVSGTPAITNANGVATLGSWTFGTTTFASFRERIQRVTATAGSLSTVFVGRAVAGAPVSMTLRATNGGTLGLPPKETLNFNDQQEFRAVVLDIYGNPVHDQTVTFSSSDNAAVSISPPTRETFKNLVTGETLTGPGILVDVRALRISADQNVEIRASLDGQPTIEDAASIAVTKTENPVANADAIQLAPCALSVCTPTVKTFTTNVLLNDNLGSPTAVITRFGQSPDFLAPIGSGSIPAGVFPGVPGSGVTVGLTADGTLTIDRLDSSVFSGAVSAIVYYELKNVGGTSLAMITISRGANGSDCTGMLGCELSGRSVTTSVPNVVRPKPPTP